MRLTFTLDATDAARLAAFWAEALGYDSPGNAGAFWPLVPTVDGEPLIVIQQVGDPSPTTTPEKNRMHLDVHVVDLDAEVARLVALGATRLSPTPVVEHDHRWYVMHDPEGNEFCLVKRPEDCPD